MGGRCGAGLELHQALQAFCEPRGLQGSLWWSQAETTWMLYDLGRWDELLAVLEAVARSSTDTGGLQALELGLAYQALVVARRGDPRAASSVIDDLLPKARAADDIQLLAPALSAAALIAAQLDDAEGAIGHVRELFEVSRDRADRHRALFLPELTRLCIAADEVDLAAELNEGLTIELGRARSARVAAAAVLAEAEGRLPDALSLYVEAARLWRDYGGIPGLTDALVGQARCLLALDRTGSEEPLAEARRLLETMGDAVGLAELAEVTARAAP